MRTSEKADDAGFTLLELMVVVLILGVLLAIAIPTFLSLTTSARSEGLESNLQIASTDEIVYYTTYNGYGTVSTSPAVGLVDSGITWTAYPAAGISETAPTKDVYLETVSPSDGTAGLILGAASSSGNRYWVYLDQADGIVEYDVTSSATSPALTAFSAKSWAQTNG